MRKSPVHDIQQASGATFDDRVGVTRATRFGDPQEEYRAVRDAVGLTDFSFTVRYRVPEDGLDVLEQYAAGSVANIRFGRVLHTLAADEQGHVETDLYIANDDEQLLVIGESLISDEQNAKILAGMGAEQAGLEDISSSTALFGLDGLNAWMVVKDLFGPDVLGLPYLSIETYELDGTEIRLLRTGKTSEFGYLLLVPAEIAASAWNRLLQVGQPHGLKVIGTDTHDVLRLDGRFFNIYGEGAKVQDPLALGLQWMIDFDGEPFRGQEAIRERRAAGPRQKIIGVQPQEGVLEPGMEIFHQERMIAQVVTAQYSPTLGEWIGLALFDWEFAYSGLEFCDQSKRSIRTVSMPPFMPKSLEVKLDEM